MTAHPWPLRSYLELGALPTAVPCARLHARHLVWEWGLNGLADSTELLVSELVTNAVKATAGEEDQTALRLQLSSDNVRVLIEVWDADPQPPVPKDLSEDGTPDPQEEGGRGLFLVATLSTRWDWYLTRAASRQGRLVRARPRTTRTLRRRPIRSAGITAAEGTPGAAETSDRGDERSGRPTPTPGSSPRPQPLPGIRSGAATGTGMLAA